MAETLPYLDFSGVLGLLTLTPQLTADMQAIQQALARRAATRRHVVVNLSATGSTTNKIKLPMAAGFTPIGVLLIRAQLKSDPGGDLTVVPRYNFAVESGQLWTYEPGGLVQNQIYDLTFLILEE